ncbi:MAG TPA: hypothetical protein VK798_12895 [Alloacidobacterium sp.]|jgi:hypothetical protein|nr:hypothetical protein [Alloacidobacterium sp.]
MFGSRTGFGVASALCGLMIVISGCKGKTEPDTSNFKTAINDSYSAHPRCLWLSPVKFPAQADASNDEQTKGFDALTDAGFLTRKAEEKKRFLIGSKQVNDYDVSDKGRTVWTPDQTQPGYGNFCYGHREVTSIDNFTMSTNQSGANTATVNYHYDLAGVPDWAKTQEMQTAFPNLQADLATPNTATATLLQTQNGWQVSAD